VLVDVSLLGGRVLRNWRKKGLWLKTGAAGIEAFAIANARRSVDDFPGICQPLKLVRDHVQLSLRNAQSQFNDMAILSPAR